VFAPVFLSGPAAKSEAYISAGQARPPYKKPTPQKAWRPASHRSAQPSLDCGGLPWRRPGPASCWPSGSGHSGTLVPTSGWYVSTFEVTRASTDLVHLKWKGTKRRIGQVRTTQKKYRGEKARGEKVRRKSIGSNGIGRQGISRNGTEKMAPLEKHCVVPFPQCLLLPYKEPLAQSLHTNAFYFRCRKRHCLVPFIVP
jgi:hypothetical protein